MATLNFSPALMSAMLEAPATINAQTTVPGSLFSANNYAGTNAGSINPLSTISGGASAQALVSLGGIPLNTRWANRLSMLRIYQGTPESWSTFTDLSTRSSDLLITYTLTALGVSYTNLGVIGNAQRFLAAIAGTPVAATGSGVATWFLLSNRGTWSIDAANQTIPTAIQAGTSATLLTDRGALMGTVGLAGSGADMEIGSTSIVSGLKYTCSGINLNFPLSWTV